MSKTPNYDAKVKVILDATELGERVCPISGKTWELDEKELEMYRKYQVPPSKYHPYMRLKMLAGWGAGVDLWWKHHSTTGKAMLSAIHPDASQPIVTDQEFYSTDWGEKFGQDYIPGQLFNDQFGKLLSLVPMPNFSSVSSENTVGGGFDSCVNSFMVFGTWSAKDSWYNFRCKETDRVFDASMVQSSSDSFSNAMCLRVNKCTQSFDCIDSYDCAYVFDAWNCQNCFCSTNLRHKQYMFMNEQLTQSEYEAKMAEIDLSRRSVREKWAKEFARIIENDAVFPEFSQQNSTDSIGDYLDESVRSSGYFMGNCIDVDQGWFNFDSERSDYLVIGFGVVDNYMVSVSKSSNDIKFSYASFDAQNCEYLSLCKNVENCFGCVGLQRKRFCILNKQYTEKEYWLKLDEIKCAMLENGEYGEFLRQSDSITGAEHSFASIISPWEEGELEKLGRRRLDPVEGMRYAPYPKTDPRDPEEVPDAISDVGEEWVGVMFEDKNQNRRFAISKQELDYRKEKGYPFPTEHYRGRLIDLLQHINGPELEEVRCAKTGETLIVGKNRKFPNRKVYKRDAYLKFIQEKN